MSWKFILIFMVSVAAVSALYLRFMMWVAKKAGITIPTGPFRKFTFENYTGNVLTATQLHGRPEL